MMILQPTSHLRQVFHFNEAVELAIKTDADSVLSVAEIPEQYTGVNAMAQGDDGFLRLVSGKPVRERIPRRQDRPRTYWSIGMIYLSKPKFLFDAASPNLYGERVAPYIVDQKYLVDINVPEDWTRAEKAMKNL
mgnify:CR=1 FL=1